MRKFILLSLLLASATAAGLFAQQATISAISGKVEVKLPGANTWEPAKIGMQIPLAATVSTGFDSSATLRIADNTLYLKPLTRLSVSRLVQEKDTLTSETFLRVGNVKAKVQSATSLSQDFSIRTPYSTASVRGTVFEFDGFNLIVEQGRVAFQIPDGRQTLVSAGFTATLNNEGISNPAPSDDEPAATAPAGSSAPEAGPQTGSIIITITDPSGGQP